ncbi:hypothetical protein [Streptomyces sp. NPDC050485]|uniref:hypothetical protein n=1 Tax=Streptomyces sp. NPDC050485 TaxID=3365617 RepID=UPI00379EF2C1
MKSLQRVLATLATTVLLTAGTAALAAPAHADTHVSVLGLVDADTNGTIDVPLGSATVVELPNFLAPVV